MSNECKYNNRFLTYKIQCEDCQYKEICEDKDMRDPNRLDAFYAELCQVHKEYFPDWRFGQLCSNFFGWLAGTKQVDLFFPEEDKMLEYLHEYCTGNISPWKKG